MFEKIVEKILNPILSEYVEDFNSENMKIGLWSGQVVIKNVKLRKEIIKKLNLPLKIKYSRLGCLKMSIPWKSLGSSKIDIVIEGLQLLITQLPQNLWECKNHKIIEARKQQIMNYCDSILQDFAKKSSNAAKDEQQKGYFGSMVTKIIDNIQVTIKDIHIRYEDDITNQYSFGVTLEDLKIFTVNKKGEPEFIDRSKKQYENQPLRKKLILSNFGFYWNERSEFYTNPEPHAEMLDGIARNNQPLNPKMNYLILMSFNAELYQRQAGKQYVEPEINLFIKFEELKVKITNQQLQQIITMSERFQGFLNQVKAQNKKKLTQQEMLGLHKEFMGIFAIYFEKKTTPEQNNRIQSILQKMEVQNFKDGIKSYLQAKQKQKMVQDKLNSKKGWFGFSKPKDLSEEELKQIENFVKDNFGLETKVVKRPEDFYYIRVNFYLKLLNVSIANTNKKGKNQEGLTVNLEQIGMDFNLRQGGYKLNFGIREINIDMYEKQQDKTEFLSRTNILRKMPAQSVADNLGQYVKLQVIGSPLDKKNLDTEINLETQQLLIEFDPRILKVAKDFADIKISSKNTQAAIEAYGQIKNKVSTSASEAADSYGKMQKKKNFISLDVKIRTINIILYFDPLNTSGDIWGISLGETKIFSDPQILKKLQFAPHQAMQKYCMSTTNTSMIHFQNKEAFFISKSNPSSVDIRQVILTEIGVDFEIEIFQKSNDKTPSIRANVTMHSLNLNLSSSTYLPLQKIGDCFTVPVKIESETKKQIEKIKANQKTEIMKQAKKIGIIFDQSTKQPKKYIGVLSAGYLYLYNDKKDIQYSTYFYVRNSKISIEKEEIDIAKRPFSLVVENSVNKVRIGFDKESIAEEWSKAIKSLQTQNQFVIKDEQKTTEEKPKKVVDPNTLNFEVFAAIESISVNNLLHVDRKATIQISSLTAHAKLHETKTLAKVSLKSLQITDNIYHYKYQQLTNFLYSESIQGKEKLIDINFEQIGEKNPQYKDGGSSISIEVGKLICNYKPETVENLMRFLLPKPAPIPEISSPSKIGLDKKSSVESSISMNSPSTIHHDEHQTQEQLKKRKQQKWAELKTQPEKYSIKLKVIVEQISIALVNRKTRVMFTKLGMDNFKLDFGLSNKKMDIEGGIGQLWVKDYSNYPNTIIEQRQEYTQFDYIMESLKQGRDMVTFNIKILEYPNQFSKTMIIKAGLNDLSTSYVQQPVLRIITYLTEQLLPSLTPSSDESKPRQVPVLQDTKPEKTTMEVIIDLTNVIAIVKPRNGQDEYLEMLIKQISVRNSSLQQPYIKNPTNFSQKVLVQNYEVKLNGISIIQKFKGKQNKLTNDLSIEVNCQLIQNTLYYQKTYGERYNPGMRVNCKLSPFLMKFNHDDYNFIMKCLFWNITFDDNADGYIFDPIIKPINKQTKTQAAPEPLYCNVIMDRIILCVNENNDVPLSVLFLSGLNLRMILGQGMNILFEMKNIFATHINPTDQQDTSIEKGMFNLFGHERKLKTSQLKNLQNLIQIYSIKSIAESVKHLNLKLESENPTIYVEYITNKYSDTIINAKIQSMKIAVQLKKLFVLAKLVLLENNIQPPKSTLVPIAKKVVAPPPPSSGKMTINLQMFDFLGCLSDKTGNNYVVIEGEFLIKLKMNGTKSESDVIEMAKKSETRNGPFIDQSAHSIELRNFSLYFCNINNLKNKRYILQPVRVFLIYTQQYGIKEDVVYFETDIQGEMEKIIVECSVRDMLMINKITQDNLQILSDNSTNKQQPEKKVQNEEEAHKLKRATSEISSLKNQDYEIDKEALEKAVKSVQKRIKDKTVANLRLQPLQIRVVNDCNNNFMPVINLIIQESNLMFTADAIKTHLANSLTIKLNFFNPRSANWEPVIETFCISVDFLNLVGQFGPTSKIIISSSSIEELKQLKINASTQLVASLLATLDIAKSQKEKIGQYENVNEIQVSPYIVENLTNKPIFVHRVLNGEASAFELKPRYKGPVKLTDQSEELNFIYEGKKYTVSLEKFGVFSIDGLDDIHFDFTMSKLNRVLTFVNKLVIKNSTSKQIYCITHKQKKVEPSICLQPGEALPLEKDWGIQLSPNDKTFTVPTKVTALPETFYLKNEKQTYKIAIKQKKLILGHSIFMARAPFSILNCLPKNMEIQFISGNKQVSSKVIPSQESHEVFASQDILNLKFKVLCEGFYWSQQFGADAVRLGKECFLFLQDRQSGGTTVKYIFEQDLKKGQYKLIVLCPAFIVSELEYDVDIYSNLERDQTNNKIEKYYKLGGQNKYWRKGESEDVKKIDKRTLIGTESGSKIRVCGQNCLIDFSQPILTKNIGVSQTRVAVQTQLHGKTSCLFTVVGVDVSLKKMSLKADIYSRQITLRARLVFINNSDYDLQIKEQGGQRFYYQINKNEKKPFYFTVPELKDKPKSLIFRSQYTGESIPVLINGLGAIYFRIQRLNEPSNFMYFKLNIQEIDSYLFYELTSVSYEDLPYKVVIKSYKIEAYVELFQRELKKQSPPLLFINEIPTQPYNLPILIRPVGSEAHQELTVQADNLNFKSKLKFPGLDAVVFVIFNDSKKYIVIDEQKTDPEKTPEYQTQTINFKLQKISLSIIQNHSDQQKPFESFFLYMQNLEFVMQKSNKRTDYQLKLQFLQLDQDQPYNIPNPVIMTPVKYKQFTSTNIKDKPKSIFNALVEIDNSFVKNMFFNKIVIDMNDLVIKIGSPLIKLALAIYKDYSDAAKAEDSFLIKSEIDTWRKIVPPPQGSKTFIKSICLAPFTLNLSAQVRLNQLDSESVVILGTLLNALGVVITNIEDAPIVLDGISLNDCNDTMQGINSKLMSHYKSSVVSQLYKIFGSLNIIGNPVSLFRNISTGFKDLKEKPADGLVEGPLEFGMGLAEGTSSLILHSVGGALNSVEKVTGTIASGLAALTFDKEFEERRQRDRMKKPKHVFEGLEKGGKAVFHGFKQGLTGLVLKPYQNAQKQGAVGFFKGVAQGLTGVVIKPVSGVIDFASKTTQGLKNTTMYLQDKPNENRIRYPRVLYTETGIVRQYDPIDSKIFSIIRKSKYQQKYHLSDDFYMQSFKISNEKFIVILSSAICCIKLDDESIIWSIPSVTSKINRVQNNVIRIEGSPKNQQFWEKGVYQSLNFQDKQSADRFEKLIVDLKINAGRG